MRAQAPCVVSAATPLPFNVRDQSLFRAQFYQEQMRSKRNARARSCPTHDHARPGRQDPGRRGAGCCSNTGLSMLVYVPLAIAAGPRLPESPAARETATRGGPGDRDSDSESDSESESESDSARERQRCAQRRLARGSCGGLGRSANPPSWPKFRTVTDPSELDASASRP